MVDRAARLIVIGLVLALAAAPAAHAATAAPAGTKAPLLRRSASNLMGGAVDAVMTPYTFSDSIGHGFYMSKRYSVLEKVFLTPLWAVVYIPSCGFVSALLPAARFAEGVAMLPVGAVTAAAGSDYDWGVFQGLPGKRSAVIQKPPMIYMGTRWCDGFFQ